MILMHTTSQRKYSFFIVFTILFILPQMQFFFTSDIRYNFVNIFISFVSIAVVMTSLRSIVYEGACVYNTFGFGYFFPLYLNTYLLSYLQIEKAFIDIHYLFTGSLLSLLLFFLIEKIPVYKKEQKKLIDINVLYLVLIFLYVILKLYIGAQKGFQIFVDDPFNTDMSFNNFQVPFFSGLAGIAQWLLLIFSIHTNKKLGVIGLFVCFIFGAIMAVNRGDVARIFVFLLIWWLVTNKELIKNKTNVSIVKKLAIRSVIFFIIFALFGEIREAFQGFNASPIVLLSKFKIDSAFLAWVYSYLAFGFDVVLLYVRAEHFQNFDYMLGFLNPSVKVSPPVYLTLWPFNASTMLRNYIAAFGPFYFIGLVLKTGVLGIFLYQAKRIEFVGMYVFIAMFVFFSFFSDYFFSRSILMAMLIGTIVFPFLSNSETKVLRFKKISIKL